MFATGVATRIYIAVVATDMENAMPKCCLSRCAELLPMQKRVLPQNTSGQASNECCPSEEAHLVRTSEVGAVKQSSREFAIGRKEGCIWGAKRPGPKDRWLQTCLGSQAASNVAACRSYTRNSRLFPYRSCVNRSAISTPPARRMPGTLKWVR